MLLIYDYLVNAIIDHLDQCKIQATIKNQIGKKWHCYRYIQVIPTGWNGSIHYEYFNNHWELHFEDTHQDAELDKIRKKSIDAFKDNNNLGWHKWYDRQRGLLRLENEVNDIESFKSSFTKIYKATYNTVDSIIKKKNKEHALDSPEESKAAYAQPKSPEIQSISELQFDRFTIPPYQRPYKWTQKNVNQLVDDILCFQKKGEYRLGTLVLHIQKDHPQKQAPLYIVDGQQRIITISLLLYQLMGEKEYSMLFNEDIRKAVTEFLEKRQFNNSLTQKNIRANLKTIRHRLADFTKETVSFFLDNCKFVTITLYDISEAFQFFDSQNARGKELAPHDLLKAFHLRVIKNMDNEDCKNIVEWENCPTDALKSLFLILYRVKRWSRTKEARYFTSQNIEVFKGLNVNDSRFPYQKIYTIAQCYTMLYNQDIARRLDGNRLNYPHQIDQVTINGSLFFDMVKYYKSKRTELEKIKSKINPKVMKAVNSINYGQGDKYIRMLFDAACLFYYDKFGKDNLKNAMDRIFAWTYGKRLKSYAIKLASVDNLALGAPKGEGESFFTMLHNSVKSSDILNWTVPGIKRNEISINPQKYQLAIDLMEQLHYVE